MTQHDQSPDTDLRAPNQTGRGLRWTVRLLFLACGLMMGVVLLSQPRVLSHVQAGADRFVGLIAQGETTRHASAEPSPQAREVELLLHAAVEQVELDLLDALQAAQRPQFHPGECGRLVASIKVTRSIVGVLGRACRWRVGHALQAAEGRRRHADDARAALQPRVRLTFQPGPKPGWLLS